MTYVALWLGRVLGRRFRVFYLERTGRWLWGIKRYTAEVFTQPPRVYYWRIDG